MSDDIVTRLRECWCSIDYTSRSRIDPECDHDGVRAEAADEIEHLRAVIENVTLAITNEGPQPKYHRAVMKKHGNEWKTLWDALDILVENQQKRTNTRNKNA